MLCSGLTGAHCFHNKLLKEFMLLTIVLNFCLDTNYDVVSIGENPTTLCMENYSLDRKLMCNDSHAGLIV